MNRKILVAVVLALLVIAAVAAGLLRKERGSSNHIKISGTIEAVTTELSFKISGRVKERLLDEGQKVSAGQVVARLEDDEIRQEYAAREADAGVARAALAELKAGSRVEEIAQAEAAMNRARAESVRAADDYRRLDELYRSDIISKRDLEQALAARDAGASALREAAERLRLVKAGPRIETKEQARARLQGAEAALSLAGTRLAQTTLASPVSGVILSKNIEPGEQVSPGTPVVTLGQLENVWVRGYVSETELPRVKLGQKAQVTVDGVKGKSFEGRIEFISQEAEFTPKNVQTEKERVRLVYRVKVAVRNPDMALKPGMPADAVITAIP